MKLAAVVVALALALPSAHSAPRADDPLPAPVAAALQKAGLPSDALAAIAIPQTRWARRWQHRADVAVQPGSTMKLVTTVVALDRLGPNLRGRTELLAAGPIDGGVLDGDLVLKGGADPELDLPALWSMLFELRQRGVREIAGSLVLDRTLFRPARIDRNLPPFDEAPEWPYNVVPDALMLSGNLMGVALAADGEAVTARLAPPLPGIELDATGMRLTDGACAAWDDEWRPALVAQPEPGRWRIALQGGFPRRCEARTWLQLLDRNLIADAQVRAVWASLGGTWRTPPGSVREGSTPIDATPVAVHVARPWGEVLRSVNKTSDNPLTRLLFLQLGVPAMKADGATPTLALAAREVERWLDENRIDRTGLVVDNGSGLSRSERITPRTLARVLETALKGKHAPELLTSLPVAGVDGTMRRRLKDTPAEGWARLKTGTLKNVTALAGTVRDTRGDAWVVVAIVNHDEAAKGRPALDALIEWVARSGARWRQ
ncbi:MAG TPA: D-alanyl-D-alanine carboxypeptidase/D-alanyl-D-alanine-endopeptidase [Burkholderiaceae bacterium]|nr:D-alanyl-D-alanine carboxypeptidase/D-alanyl-D-alanine-endopeptidase [Burkholderiaceae bacterium]